MGIEQIWNIVWQEFSNLDFTTIGNMEPLAHHAVFVRGTLIMKNVPVGGIRMNVGKGGEVTCTILGTEGSKSAHRMDVIDPIPSSDAFTSRSPAFVPSVDRLVDLTTQPTTKNRCNASKPTIMN